MAPEGHRDCEGWGKSVNRRTVLGGCTAAVLFTRAARADEAEDPTRAERPQKGDQLVYFTGDKEGAPIKPDELKVGDEPVLAWAYDPVKKVPRDGSRLNMVLVLRLDPTRLGKAEGKLAAEGVVAFSAICTHQQCPVTEWLSGLQHLRCPCHQSEYDPMHEAAVVGGPAPRPLPALPLAIADGLVQVAGPFNSKVGGETQGTG